MAKHKNTRRSRNVQRAGRRASAPIPVDEPAPTPTDSERANACHAAIRADLARFGCVLEARPNPSVAPKSVAPGVFVQPCDVAVIPIPHATT